MGYLGISRVMKISLPKLNDEAFGSSTEFFFDGSGIKYYFNFAAWSFFLNTELRDRQTEILFFLFKYLMVLQPSDATTSIIYKSCLEILTIFKVFAYPSRCLVTLELFRPFASEVL